ncbi:LPP20 family lipoprotein [Pseudoalteromonas piratica]|uniref:LPP20 family lipoprotein n=1 Tax=Pseudoalteromonas piratica TaxID=1348114 RepID=UPI0009DD6716|nr:LPP20 family lipoprotein [Pseudoalteromonas piratica]
MSHSFFQTTVIAGCILLGGCSQMFDKHVEYEYQTPENFPVLYAVGYAPISLQPGSTEQQKAIMAMKASKLEAYRELAEQVYGQKVDAQTSVQGMVANNDSLKVRVQGVVRGAKVVKSYAVGDTYATEVELDMKLVHDLYVGQTRPRSVKKVTYF